MVRLINYRISIVLILILLLNSLINLFNYKLEINFFDLSSGLFLFLFLYTVGKLLNKTLNLKSISAAILLYLLSFFVFDLAILFFIKSYSFSTLFLFVNLFWFLFLILNLDRKIEIIKPVASLIVLKYFFLQFKSNLTFNQNIIGDVEAVFFSQSKNIYENSYYFSVNNYVMEGYPQLTSYIQSLFFQFVQQNGEYNFYSFTSHIIFYLSILFFLELNLKLINKITLIIVFSLLILNSGWLQFLITTSLMSEGIVSLFTSIGVYYLLNNIFKSKESFSSLIFCFLLGTLYFLKQFNSIIFLFLIILLFLFDNKNKSIPFLFSGVIIKELLYMFVFVDIGKDHHIRQIDLSDTILDLLLLRDLDLMNIYLILKNLLIDKPLTILVVVFFTTIFLNSKKDKTFFSTNLAYFMIINLNFLLIIALYISVWQNMELDSPIRYVLNFIHLLLISIISNINNFQNYFFKK